MNSTVFISIRPVSQDPSKWTVTKHIYDPTRSEEKVEVVALSKLLSKNEALRQALVVSEKEGRSFILPNTGVIALCARGIPPRRTYQVIGICQDGDVGTIGKKFRNDDPLKRLFEGLDLADRIATAANKLFIPPFFVEDESKKSGSPWKQTLNVVRLNNEIFEKSGVSSKEKKETMAFAKQMTIMTSQLPQDMKDTINGNLSAFAKETLEKHYGKDQKK